MSDTFRDTFTNQTKSTVWAHVRGHTVNHKPTGAPTRASKVQGHLESVATAWKWSRKLKLREGLTEIQGLQQKVPISCCNTHRSESKKSLCFNFPKFSIQRFRWVFFFFFFNFFSLPKQTLQKDFVISDTRAELHSLLYSFSQPHPCGALRVLPFLRPEHQSAAGCGELTALRQPLWRGFPPWEKLSRSYGFTKWGKWLSGSSANGLHSKWLFRDREPNISTSWKGHQQEQGHWNRPSQHKTAYSNRNTEIIPGHACSGCPIF